MNAITNSTAAFYNRSLLQMGGLREAAEKLQLQISTQQKLQQSSDDPVAAARLRALNRAGRLADIYASNADSANRDISTAASTMEDISSAIIRARELAVMAASDTATAAERSAVANELEQLRASIFSSANATSMDGQSLFGGEVSGAAYTMDAAGTVTYVGTSNSAAIDIADGVKVDRGITGPSFLNFEVGGSPTDAFAFIGKLVSDLRTAGDPAQAARDALGGFDTAIDSLGRSQTILGARIAWVETVQQTQTTRAETRTQEGNSIGGVDLTSAFAQMQQILTVLEASQASFGKLANLSLFSAL